MSPSKRADTKVSITFWMEKALLNAWNEHCEKKSISRTQLIIDAVTEKITHDESFHDLSMKIDRLAEIVSDFTPDAESLIAESRRLNTRGRVLEQVLVTREMGIRRENIKGFSSYAMQVALESLERDDLIKGDKFGTYWLREFFPATMEKDLKTRGP